MVARVLDRLDDANHGPTLVEGDPRCTAEGSVTATRVLDGRAIVDMGRPLSRALARRGAGDAARVAVIVPPGASWLAAVVAVWRRGAAAVPLLTEQPEGEVAHALTEARVTHVVTTDAERTRLAALFARHGAPVLSVDDGDDVRDAGEGADPRAPADAEAPALVLFTSGTTGRPKAAVLSRRAIDAQVAMLTEAWKWSSRDHILAFLPLHHVHGIVNVLLSALASGARVTFAYPFDAARIVRRVAAGDITLFMAVPTIWKRVLDVVERDDETSARGRAAFARMRLLVSGSAALDAPTFERIARVLSQAPLERYGMTEIGMALSNPLDGERVKGTVGFPLPSVSVRLADDDGRVVEGGIAADDAPAEGEIEVRGPALFSGYLFRDDATRASFTDDGWFKTGDFARRAMGRYTILGRRSSDILKTGGEKVSALEIEDVIAAMPGVRAVAVVGVASDDWGQEVTAVVEPTDPDAPPTRAALRAFAKEHLALFKVPRRVFVVDALPRNALGKVQKSVLVDAIARHGAGDAAARAGMREATT